MESASALCLHRHFRIDVQVQKQEKQLVLPNLQDPRQQDKPTARSSDGGVLRHCCDGSCVNRPRYILWTSQQRRVLPPDPIALFLNRQ